VQAGEEKEGDDRRELRKTTCIVPGTLTQVEERRHDQGESGVGEHETAMIHRRLSTVRREKGIWEETGGAKIASRELEESGEKEGKG